MRMKSARALDRTERERETEGEERRGEERAFKVLDELVADATDLLEPLEFGGALYEQRRERCARADRLQTDITRDC